MKMILKAAVVLAAALSIAGCSKKAGSQKAEAVSTAPAIEIAFGDYDAMVSLSSKLQNGGCEEGQTVIIDGELSVFMSASIGQRNGDEYIGTTLELEDTELDAYPEDGSRVKVTAKVAKNAEYGFEYLTAKPENLIVVEE